MSAVNTVTSGAGEIKKGGRSRPVVQGQNDQSRSPVNAMINCSRLTKTL
jgi:hypothetical protein